ncbi:MAG: VgrG-related protein [Solirubrobacteraceae bacterium]|nr:VgrG-related protein [Solirubrobacteraceae bacterium]
MSDAQHVADLEVRVDGAALDPEVAAALIEARVQDDLLLPDAFQLRFRDPRFELCDGAQFDVGKQVELRLQGPAGGSSGLTTLFKGSIATLAPEFETDGCIFVVRGFDVSHKLNLTRRSRTFQDMTASDIARKVVSEAGLQIDATATSQVSEFEQQSNETDWNFLWRLAARCGYTVTCSDGTIAFRPGARAEEAALRVEWGRNLQEFRPRATAVQQVDEVEVSGWDPSVARRVSGRANTAKLDSQIGLERDQVASTGGGGTLLVADQIVTTQGEADDLAQATLDHVANAWLEADGSADGDPRMRAGAPVEIAGVGQKFGGRYLITGATHIVRAGTGYKTRFRISGRARRTLLDLLTPTTTHAYGEALVIGQVTNVDDPDHQNRVRVKFPALDDQHEGWWARLASPAASGGRGLLMLPKVGDEVIVGFEHGDERRPLVLGSLWNGAAPPGDLIQNGEQGGGGSGSDGSFNLVSDAAVTVKASQQFDLQSSKVNGKADGDIKLESGSTFAVKGGKVTLNGDGSVTIESNGSVKLSGSAIEVNASGTLKLSGASVTIG